MSGFGHLEWQWWREIRAVWILMDFKDPPDAPDPGLNPHLAKSP